MYATVDALFAMIRFNVLFINASLAMLRHSPNSGANLLFEFWLCRIHSTNGYLSTNLLLRHHHKRFKRLSFVCHLSFHSMFGEILQLLAAKRAGKGFNFLRRNWISWVGNLLSDSAITIRNVALFDIALFRAMSFRHALKRIGILRLILILN